MFLVVSLVPVAAQDVPNVPKDSTLVILNGCAKDGKFVVGERREDQAGTLEIQPGRRFRLNGAWCQRRRQLHVGRPLCVVLWWILH